MKVCPQRHFYYFVHSYYVRSQDVKLTCSITNYGHDIVSCFEKDNVFGVQFHPEKSHRPRLRFTQKLCDIKCIDQESFRAYLLENDGLVKTLNFTDPVYIGDAMNCRENILMTLRLTRLCFLILELLNVKVRSTLS